MAMIQKQNSHNGRKGLQRSLWFSSACWLGGMGLLAPIALAQTALDPAVIESASPAAPVEVVPVEAAPVSSPAVSSELEQTAPAAPIAPITPAASQPIDSVGSAPIAPPEASPPEASSPEASSPLVVPNLADNAAAAFNHSGNYIDTTPYSIGATEVDQPDVVLSERSTGCQTTLAPGQSVPTSICPPAPSVASANTYAPPAATSWESVGIGSYSMGGRTTPSGRSYVNLTIRPPVQLTSSNVNLFFPLSIPAAITSAFGWRIHPVTGSGRFHSGTDLGAPQGTPVLAAFAGEVSAADYMGGYGLAIVLRHSNNTEETLYGHLSQIFVKPGEKVQQGQVIGQVGSTGMSTGPHLHFEFHKLTPEGWVVMDPGATLEYSMAQLIKGLQTAAQPKPAFPALADRSFMKALQMAQAAPKTLRQKVK
ncbi:MAG TPA: peptidoglycan DD-metalloendopeptidase family protein [Trichocoleus sp.]|jgi:hypothetical protein